MTGSESDSTSRLEAEVIRLLVERRQTLAVAESSTGGLIGHRLTEVPGSSTAFLGGIIAYHNRLKERQLGVPREVLEREGAVSAAVARAMAEGARRLTSADIGLAVTGIAGPAGGTAEKPVGLTYVALAAENASICERHAWQGDRWQNKQATAQAALALLRRYLESGSS